MKKIIACLVLLFSACTGSSLNAQTSTRMRVVLDCTCQQGLGESFATALRDELATSPRYVEIPDNEKNRGFWHIRVVTTKDPDSISVAYAFTIDDTFFTMGVSVCGKQRMSDCVQGVFTHFDAIVHER
jgi:hypothetical protein